MAANTPARTENPVLRTDASFIAEPVYEETTRHRAYRFTLAATRLALGWIFLSAFLDKAFGLGHATPAEGAWIDGGSPTEGSSATPRSDRSRTSTTASPATPGRTGSS